MTLSPIPGVDPMPKNKLPRRDWVVMPLLTLLTFGAAYWALEAIAKGNFSEPTSGRSRCSAYLDPWIGISRPADCTYVEVSSEGVSTRYHLNKEGYREEANLSPKTPGMLRIVMVGTSFGIGGGSPKNQTIADLLPQELSAKLGRPVELYNESIAGFPGLPQNLDRRFQDVLAAQPDIILWQMTRWDIKADDLTAPEDENTGGRPAAVAQQSKGPSLAGSHGLHRMLSSAPMLFKDVGQSARSLYTGSRVASLFATLLNQSQSQYIASSLHGSDAAVGYLNVNKSPFWSGRYMRFDAQLASVAARARAAHVPVVLTVLPTRVQVAMVSGGEWPASYDPYKLASEVGGIADAHQVYFVDVLPGFRNVLNAENGYRVGDGHPNASGNRMLASLLAEQLTRDALPAMQGQLWGAMQQQSR